MSRSRRHFGWLLAAAGWLALALPAALADDGAVAKAYRQGYNLILDEDWAGATAAFSQLLERHPDSDWADDAAFWRCYARQQLEHPAAEVFACYDGMLERYPDSEWEDDARRAMVRLAQQLDRQGRPEYRQKVSDFGQSEDGDRLLAILVALGEIGDERSVSILLERLDGTRDEHLRASIVEVLEDVDSPRVLAKLKSLLASDPSERVRLAALETLADHDSFDSVELMKSIALDPKQPIRLRVEALEAYGDDRPAGVVTLLEELALGENGELAMEAIDEIGDLENAEALEILTRLLDRIPDFERRREIVDALGDFELEGAVAVLLEIARGDPDPRIRREATESLGDVETESARDALIQLLQEIEN